MPFDLYLKLKLCRKYKNNKIKYMSNLDNDNIKRDKKETLR